MQILYFIKVKDELEKFLSKGDEYREEYREMTIFNKDQLSELFKFIRNVFNTYIKKEE